MAFSNTNAFIAESGVETVGSFMNCVFRTQPNATAAVVVVVVVVIIIIPELKHTC